MLAALQREWRRVKEQALVRELATLESRPAIRPQAKEFSQKPKL
jgi:hypothetical protein